MLSHVVGTVGVVLAHVALVPLDHLVPHLHIHRLGSGSRHLFWCFALPPGIVRIRAIDNFQSFWFGHTRLALLLTIFMKWLSKLLT